ncbi:hypothetical protein [Bradyrhizobium sp. WSM1417]|uniref:hypothetical protein n=1 Tax=Bradyrhizobium sp. WSM1417 TaxID=754500 RepID=UPI00048383C6|nr:hypothetical protein [Bradyrhizobium sp. WSM1417]
MKRAGRRGTTAGDPGWSNCVFCGTAVGKSARSREHIIPMWLLRATGDPHRKIKIESDPITGDDVVRPASTFHFPACEPCNQKYGKTIEKHAKKAIESLFIGKSLAVSQCYWFLDWLDKVRVGLWLGYNMLHKEEFAPKFRIDQRIGIKDRIAIISVDPNDRTKGFGFGGLDNQIFRTSQAGMFFKINNIRILSLSFDGLISRFAGMPFPEELLALSNDPDRHIAMMGRTDYRLKQDWKEFQMPGATVIAQTSFWLANCTDNKSFALWINKNTIPRFKKFPKLRKAADLNQFVQTKLVSNANGEFRYHQNGRQRIRFGRADDNSDLAFIIVLYLLFLQYVLPLNPQEQIEKDGTRHSTILLAMLWIEKSVQLALRFRQIGIWDETSFGPVVEELQKVYRAWDELRANALGEWAQDASANQVENTLSD